MYEALAASTISSTASPAGTATSQAKPSASVAWVMGPSTA